MTPDPQRPVVLLFVQDALEATANNYASASMLLIKAAISLTVTHHKDDDARRQFVALYAEYGEALLDVLIEAERQA
ncbi:MAG: hypothetical protein EON59_08160 [Alphaproteobacteria bacterium]|nr:MAG: hypothetical protein EON59_08160 [Alphaproteobacteria bacterium]